MAEKIQFTIDFDIDLDQYLENHFPEVVDYHILSKALDARGANRGKKPRYTYHLDTIKEGERFARKNEVFKDLGPLKTKPIIVGAGPGGLFAALRFQDYGVPSIIIERGDRAHRRMIHIAKFWRYGEFDPETNVCYGEGGAGLFSDGKLITRVKSPYVQYVMDRMVDFGAPEEIAYLSNPHLGSNKIRLLINKISDYLTSKGSEIYYNTRVEELIYDHKNGESKVVGVRLQDGREMYSDHVILATGHSAKEVYQHLAKHQVGMAHKDFAVGVRIEHPREVIDQIQYGLYAGREELGAARYRLAWEDPGSKKGTYSFCMCPGGYVLSSGTDREGIVVNGMSNYARNSRWSNAALVVSVNSGKDFSPTEILSGLEFQTNIEKKAFEVSCAKASGKELPFQTLQEFLDHKVTNAPLPKTSTPSGLVRTDLREILPQFISDHLAKALHKFNQQLPGFVSEKALLIAPETRTSAPLTILRNKETLESTTHKGLYPCGEGAGHAGGITSAAVDGIKIVMSILKKEKGFEP